MTYPHPEPDPMDDALVDRPSYFAGKITTEAWNCVLEPGRGKVPFDPELHKGQRKSVVIEITIEPLDPARKLISRDALNWTPEFRLTIRPSIEALVDKIAGIRGLKVGEFNPLREISGLYVIGEFVQRPDNKPGQTWTTLKFLDVFATHAECQAAHRELLPDSDDNASGNGNQQSAKPDPARATLAAFFPALWEQAGRDITQFEKLLLSNPMLAAFSMESPEVQALVGQPDLPL